MHTCSTDGVLCWDPVEIFQDEGNAKITVCQLLCYTVGDCPDAENFMQTACFGDRIDVYNKTSF